MYHPGTAASIVKSSVHLGMPLDPIFGEITQLNKQACCNTSLRITEDQVDQLIQSKILKADRSWVCADCNHTTSNRTHLYEHIESKHVSSGYNCQYCQKFAPSRNALRSHVNKYHKV